MVFGFGQSLTAGEQTLQNCAALLHRGETVGFFPQGNIHPAFHESRTHTGAIVLSHQTQMPILPVRITGTKAIWPITGWPIHLERLHSVHITIGRTTAPPNRSTKLLREEYQAHSDTMQRAISALHE